MGVDGLWSTFSFEYEVPLAKWVDHLIGGFRADHRPRIGVDVRHAFHKVVKMGSNFLFQSAWYAKMLHWMLSRP